MPSVGTGVALSVSGGERLHQPNSRRGKTHAGDGVCFKVGDEPSGPTLGWLEVDVMALFCATLA